MVKADHRTIEAFASPTGQVIAEFLEACQLEKTVEVMETDEDIRIYRAQGAGLELKEIVKLANESRSILHST